MAEYKAPEFDHVQVKLDEFGKGSVIVNGQPLKSSMGVSLEAEAGQPTIVTIRLLASVDYEVLVKSVGARVAIPLDRDDEDAR
jgi:hypothetical protein